MLIVVYYRNDMYNKSKLISFLHDIKLSSTQIKLYKIANESLNNNVSDILCLSLLVTYLLGAFLTKKTNNNSFLLHN